MQKQAIPINFSGDVDTKTDPFQVAPNNFLSFNNAVRSTGGMLKKRNGFQNLFSFSLPYATSLATFNGGLLGIGSSIQSYTSDTGLLSNRGVFQPISLSVLPAIRTNSTQTSCDVAIAPNGLACVCATDSYSGTTRLLFQIIDSVTGTVVLPIQIIESGSIGIRVWILGTYFVIVYSKNNSLKYLAIPYATPESQGTWVGPTVFSTDFYGSQPIFDGVVYNNNLYLTFGSHNDGSTFTLIAISSLLVVGTPSTQAVVNVQYISITVDSTQVTPVIWVSWVSRSGGSFTVYTEAFTLAFSVISGPGTLWVTSTSFVTLSITSVAQNNQVTVYVGHTFVYSGPGWINTPQYNADTIFVGSYTTGGVLTPMVFLVKGVTLASKALINPINGTTYFLGFSSGQVQPTYFLIDSNGNVLAKLAYSNGAPSNLTLLTSINQVGSTITLAYLYKDLITPVNKTTGTTNVGGIYSQAGVNIATISLGVTDTETSEIGGTLALTGGFPWMFDGEKPVELGFHLYPEEIGVSVSGSGGSLAAQTYFYQVTYEWTDATGNIHRSAPSIPVTAVTTGSSSSVTLNIPTLRLTAKTGYNSVRIVVYRWSTANQIYYQITSLQTTVDDNPMIINDPTANYLTFLDKLNDSSIIGNNIIYTNGGVLENIAGPACEVMTLFDNRLWILDSEDKNLLWFSKQVVESTPIEMTDLLTTYVSPSTSSQASTGPTKAMAPMDDKLILFKANAIYYINGTGPDITGSNNQYSQPIFVTASVGCSNPQSIVLMPAGLMFQSNQGIWILGRDLSTKYIGAPIESLNSYPVTSAVKIPDQTQVRLTLSNGVAVVYDYYYEKWDTISPVSAVSSVIFSGLHTFLDVSGKVWRETPGVYVDGTNSVNMSFMSPWYNLAGLQGYERAYYFYLLGTYLSGHSLSIQIYYDYSETVAQTILYMANGSTSLEQVRFFLKRQKCESFKISVTEIDSVSGAGLTLSGINLIVGIKKAYKPIRGAQSVG